MTFIIAILLGIGCTTTLLGVGWVTFKSFSAAVNAVVDNREINESLLRLHNRSKDLDTKYNNLKVEVKFLECKKHETK